MLPARGDDEVVKGGLLGILRSWAIRDDIERRPHSTESTSVDEVHRPVVAVSNGQDRPCVALGLSGWGCWGCDGEQGADDRRDDGDTADEYVAVIANGY